MGNCSQNAEKNISYVSAAFSGAYYWATYCTLPKIDEATILTVQRSEAGKHICSIKEEAYFLSELISEVFKLELRITSSISAVPNLRIFYLDKVAEQIKT